MRFTKRTFYSLGVVAAAFTVLGGVMLLFSGYMALLYNLASVGAGGMMLFLIPKVEDRVQKFTSLAGCFCMVVGMIGGAVTTLPGAVGAVGGAIGWPIFAFGYWRVAEPEAHDNIRTCANLVFLMGLVQLVGSFLTVMPGMLRICLSIIIGIVQGLFAWMLRRNEPEREL
ncbi:MAG: hypothetical protein RSE54_01335 [Ruthenibacterium sp.]